jgi:hypothetical protein
MERVFEIPLKGGRGSFQTVTLNQVAYQLAVHWCEPLEAWVIDIADDLGNLIIGGVPMITGADLLAQYRYIEFGGALIAQSDFDWRIPPNFLDLGSLGHLYWIPLPPPPPPPMELPVSPPDKRNPGSVYVPPPVPTGPPLMPMSVSANNLGATGT